MLNPTLYHAADALRVIAALVDPVMPEAAERIRRMLGVAQRAVDDAAGAARSRPAPDSATIEPLFPTN